jgi:hypothetical protein
MDRFGEDETPPRPVSVMRTAPRALALTGGTRDLPDVTFLEQQRSGFTPRHLALLTGGAVLAALPFVLGLVVPYLVNGLDRLPLEELTSGAYDPKDLWPQPGSSWRTGVGVAVLLSFTVALPAFIVVTVLAAWGALSAGRARRAIALGFAVLALACGAALVWLMGPTGSALVTWRMD